MARKALLLIDAQRAFWGAANPAATASFPSFEANVTKLLAAYRSCEQTEVIHIHAAYTNAPWLVAFKKLNPQFSPSMEAYANNPAIDFAKPLSGELIIGKPTFDGFQDTQLAQKLKELEVGEVHCAGLVTSACVLMTAHGAFSRGFNVSVVEDCSGDRSVERHEACLDTYGGYMFERIKIADA
jgi:nicotinamidase-related amidase